MKLSEELLYRGFVAETTIENPEELDNRESKKMYWGADPSADSLTIGNLAALMMCACFVRHGFEPYLLVGGATGQIGDPKDNGERDLKSLDEVEHNKKCIKCTSTPCFFALSFISLCRYYGFCKLNICGNCVLSDDGKHFSQ